MQLDRTVHAGARAARLSIGLAKSRDDVRAAQRLRWHIFAEEQGANLHTTEPGYDADALDAYCEHLVVKETATNTVIGTYRLLSHEGAVRHGSYYSEQEFDLSRLFDGKRRLLEIGRSCVHRDHRNGATIALLWSGIAAFLVDSRHDGVIGCASIPLNGQEEAGMQLACRLAAEHSGGSELAVIPRVPLPYSFEVGDKVIATPPLIKGYLRSGGVICGEPYWDRAFNTADLFMYLAVSNLEARYARHFMAPLAAGA